METTTDNNTLLAETYLKVDSCPSCGADRNCLRDSLKEEPVLVMMPYRGVAGCIVWRKEKRRTENYCNARMIIDNCPDCKKVFGFK